MEAANFPTFLKSRNTENQTFYITYPYTVYMEWNFVPRSTLLF